MMTPDDYAERADQLAWNVVLGDAHEQHASQHLSAARTYALLAVASALSRIAEGIENTQT